jgi:signal transduction histidine kinase
MNELFLELTSILVEAPGNLIYHLVLAFSIGGSLQAALSHWRSSRFPQVRRTILGLSILLLGQLVLFAVSAMSWQALIDPVLVLPPLDRAISLFSLVWIAWLWVFPEPNRPADAGNALLSILVFTGLALSYVDWIDIPAAQRYNQILQDTFWQSFSLGLIAIAGLALSIRRPNGWHQGLIFFALAFLGHTFHLLFGYGQGNFPGTVRLFYLAAYPLLFTLSQRFPVPTPLSASQHSPTIVQDKDGPIRERRRYSTDPKTFHALLSLASEVDADKTNHAITRAIAQTMLADLCFLIYLIEDTKQMVIASGYDLIREENLEGSSLNKEAIPMLANALQRGKSLRLPQSSTSPDLQGLGELLHLANPGHLLSAPILDEKKTSIGGVLLLSPYSNRLWNPDDQTFLASISASLLSIIQRGKKLEEIKRGKARVEEVSDEYRLQIATLRDEKNRLATELEKIEKDVAHTEDQSESVEALLALQEDAQREIAKLQKEIEVLNARPPIPAAEKIITSENLNYAHAEGELRTALTELAHLQNQHAKANLRILELESGPSKEDPGEQAAVIASISQELRQPMSSIVGYTDLLLGESVGILGALQRKFVERIKASIERVGNLVDDIIQVSTLEVGLTELKTEPVDLNTIIDNAMSYTSSQAREKNISIHLELPKELPPIHADTDALQQILIHLLQNAGAASPVDGTVTLRVKNHKEKEQDFILLQVADTGGGIPGEDIQRVFTRLYRAENVLIQGVGDTGVGLSIAKTLTEAQNGRIWVDSEENIGATFSVLLPVSRSGASEN